MDNDDPRIGERVRDLDHLDELRQQKRSVIVPGHQAWCRSPRPAAFAINLSGLILRSMFNKGMYVYEKHGKNKESEVPGE